MSKFKWRGSAATDAEVTLWMTEGSFTPTRAMEEGSPIAMTPIHAPTTLSLSSIKQAGPLPTPSSPPKPQVTIAASPVQAPLNPPSPPKPSPTLSPAKPVSQPSEPVEEFKPATKSLFSKLASIPRPAPANRRVTAVMAQSFAVSSFDDGADDDAEECISLTDTLSLSPEFKPAASSLFSKLAASQRQRRKSIESRRVTAIMTQSFAGGEEGEEELSLDTVTAPVSTAPMSANPPPAVSASTAPVTAPTTSSLFAKLAAAQRLRRRSLESRRLSVDQQPASTQPNDPPPKEPQPTADTEAPASGLSEADDSQFKPASSLFSKLAASNRARRRSLESRRVTAVMASSFDTGAEDEDPEGAIDLSAVCGDAPASQPQPQPPVPVKPATSLFSRLSAPRRQRRQSLEAVPKATAETQPSEAPVETATEVENEVVPAVKEPEVVDVPVKRPPTRIRVSRKGLLGAKKASGIVGPAKPLGNVTNKLMR